MDPRVPLGHSDVIELLSHRDDGASWIVSTFADDHRNHETQTECNEHVCLCVETGSGADMPEVAALDCVVGSLNSPSAVVRYT